MISPFLDTLNPKSRSIRHSLNNNNSNAILPSNNLDATTTPTIKLLSKSPMFKDLKILRRKNNGNPNSFMNIHLNNINQTSRSKHWPILFFHSIFILLGSMP